jgi:hypothetical protein
VTTGSELFPTLRIGTLGFSFSCDPHILRLILLFNLPYGLGKVLCLLRNLVSRGTPSMPSDNHHVWPLGRLTATNYILNFATAS